MKKRIALLGGGFASLATAFELTNRPGWHDRYSITLYQEGWRLGGKGASGRNADMGQRIEEHGLHLMFGFYDNTFRLMRECYEELGRNPNQPLSAWTDAFKPHDLIVMQEFVDDAWLPWPILFPRNNNLPGDPSETLTPWDYVKMLLEWASNALHASPIGPTGPAVEADHVVTELSGDREQLRQHVRAAMGESASESNSVVDSLRRTLEDTLRGAWNRVTRTARAASELTEDATQMLHLALALALAKVLPGQPEQHDDEDHNEILWLIDGFREWLGHLDDDVDGLGDEARTTLRRLRIAIDFSMAVVRGMIADGLIFPPHDFFSIDNLDLSAWLRKHGAGEETVESPLVRGPYDAAFTAFHDVGAGTALHGILRMSLTYKGSVLWKMQAGMGDVIFVPLYEVLRRRGVKFEYFHQVDDIELTDDKKKVARVNMTVQATLKEGEYQPLVDVKGLPCWPDRPNYDQLIEGDALRDQGAELENWWTDWPGVGKKTIEAGRDFDTLVLGISIGVFPYICKQLIEDTNNPRFASMVEHVATTQTRAAQLWFRPDLEGLGWRGPSPVVVPFAEPFDTWADMSHLLPREQWPEGAVGNLAYLVSPLPDDEPLPPRDDHEYPERQTARVRKMLDSWLETYAGALWPKAATTDNANALNSWMLYDPEDRDGAKRVDAQFWHAGHSPSERYVLAVPGSIDHRLYPDESGYENLVLTGDWTKNFLSVGCLECTMSSGILAAKAIDPSVRDALGDWRPPRPSSSPIPAAGPDTPPMKLAPRLAAPRRELPQWIDRDNDQVAFAPVRIDTTVYMFGLRADYDALTALCNSQLNLAGETEYVPLAPLAIMYCSRVDNFPLQNPIGWVPEIDYGIWVPLLAGRRRGSIFVPERVVMYTPYIWVSNGVALIGGRSVFGFVKELGQMTLPSGPEDAARFTLDSLVLPNYGPEARAEQRRVLEIERRENGLWSELQTLWSSGGALLDSVGDRVEQIFSGQQGLPIPTVTGARNIIDQMRHGMRMVFLKQFPDAAQPRRACYQAVLEADLPIEGSVKGGWLDGDYEIRIHRYDSVRIVDTLGLGVASTEGNVATLHPLLHSWARFKATVEPGTIIWERP